MLNWGLYPRSVRRIKRKAWSSSSETCLHSPTSQLPHLTICPVAVEPYAQCDLWQALMLVKQSARSGSFSNQMAQRRQSAISTSALARLYHDLLASSVLR